MINVNEFDRVPISETQTGDYPTHFHFVKFSWIVDNQQRIVMANFFAYPHLETLEYIRDCVAPGLEIRHIKDVWIKKTIHNSINDATQ